MLVVSFGLGPITMKDGPIEIASGTQDMPRTEALRAAESGEIELRSVPLEVGDVLIAIPGQCTGGHQIRPLCRGRLSAFVT